LQNYADIMYGVICKVATWALLMQIRFSVYGEE